MANLSHHFGSPQLTGDFNVLKSHVYMCKQPLFYTGV
jgi:hypothetical protein